MLIMDTVCRLHVSSFKVMLKVKHHTAEDRIHIQVIQSGVYNQQFITGTGNFPGSLVFNYLSPFNISFVFLHLS